MTNYGEIEINSEEVNQYLRRLRLTKETPTIDYLNRLQKNHHLYIPFDNLDVMDKRHIELTAKSLFKKIITNSRGGYCFELNGIFANLLQSLGFSVYMIEAAVYNEKLQAFGYMRNHMALIVTIDDELYLTDVGFGDSFRTPISLKLKRTSDISGSYQIKEYEASHHRLGQEKELTEDLEYLILEHTINDIWTPQYKFHYTHKLNLEEYQDNCNWVESSTDSHFTHGRTWTIAKRTGRVSLSENGITITENSVKSKFEYDNLKGFNDYIEEYLP